MVFSIGLSECPVWSLVYISGHLPVIFWLVTASDLLMGSCFDPTRVVHTFSGTYIMMSILGIDAAWTPKEPSGVALVQGNGSGWRTICVAPSYDAFIACASGQGVDWQSRTFEGSAPDIKALLTAAQSMTGNLPTLVAIDMPISTAQVSGRRQADQAISRVFGSRGCSTHTPTPTRPGPLGAKLVNDLASAGYPLLTSGSITPDQRGTIEVYPHPALLVLLGREYRVPYKISKSLKYWKGVPRKERIIKLIMEFNEINSALRLVFGETQVPLPSAIQVRTLESLKRYEDSLDALVSAWVGCMCLSGYADAYGDLTAAIWVPFRKP